MVFTPDNWNQPFVVTVTGIDDDLVDGDQHLTVSVTVVKDQSDDQFDDLPTHTLDLTNLDNDAAGIHVSETQVTVLEFETSETLDVVLTAKPLENVVVDVSASMPNEATVEPSALTFTPTNWQQAQIVTIRGVDDDETDGDQLSTVTLFVSQSNDPVFAAAPDVEVSVRTSTTRTFTSRSTSSLRQLMKPVRLIHLAWFWIHSRLPTWFW